MEHNNSDNKGAARKVSQLVLTFDHETFTLAVTGSVENCEAAIAMCGMCERQFEEKMRTAQAAAALKIAPGGTLDFMRRRTR